MPEPVTFVVGTRPNFIKAGPLWHFFLHHNQKLRLVHSGQHYDYSMNRVFFEELDLPEPDSNLEVGSGSHGWQTGQMLIRLEEEFITHHPRLVIVFGDVNSTLAAALAASKLHIPIAHVEAGVRSGDISMPEEVNRIVVDSISDFLLAPTHTAVNNLTRSGVNRNKIFHVGNIMVESLLNISGNIMDYNPITNIIPDLESEYVVLTLHRAENTRDAHEIEKLLSEISETVGKDYPVIFPVHPRTAKCIGLTINNNDTFYNNDRWEEIYFIPPLGYFEFLNIIRKAQLVLTDSGGLQVETTILGVPCVTLRDTTEWPETIAQGTNVLLGSDMEKLSACCREALQKDVKKNRTKKPPFWDTKVSERIYNVLKDI
jgi:UDP-N-acetylglucosamine 2-epimerase